MRLALVFLLCLSAAAIQSSTTTSSPVTHFESLWTTKVDSAGESKTPSTTSTDPVTSYVPNSVDSAGESKTPSTTSTDPVTSYDPNSVDSAGESKTPSTTSTGPVTSYDPNSVDSAGESKTPSTTSTDPVTSYDSNSVSNEDALTNSKTTSITKPYSITNTESYMVTSTAIISYTEEKLSKNTSTISSTEETSVTSTDFITDTDSGSISNTMWNSISNTGVNTNTEAALTTNADPVTNTDSTPVSTDAVTNTDPISTINTDLESTSTAEQTELTSYSIRLSSEESSFTTLSDLSTPSNTDPTEMIDETLTSFTTTADSLTISSGTPTEGSSSTSTILTTLGLEPSANSPISTSDTWFSTATSSSASVLPISSTSAESASVSDITTSGEITLSSTSRSTKSLSSTTGTVSDSPSVVVTDLLSTTSPSSLSTAITLNLTTTNTESTSSDTAVPTVPSLSTTTTISTTSTSASHPPTYQDPAIYNRTIETLASILLVLQNLLNKIQNETQITPEKRSTSDLDNEDRNQIDDEGIRSMLTPVFRVNHHRSLLGLVSGTENLSDPDQDLGTSMKPPGESPDIGRKEPSLCTSQAPPGDVCHKLGTALDATDEVLERTQEEMHQLNSEILEQLEQRDDDLEQLIATSDGNYSHVDRDKASKKIKSVMQRARGAKMTVELVLANITSSLGDRSWVFVYALAGAVAGAVFLLLCALVCLCRRRQSKPASTLGYEEARGLSQEIDRFHDKLSYENEGMSVTSNHSESLSSFQDCRRQTSPDQINSKPRGPRKSGQQNQISLYPQTRKGPYRDTLHLEVGNNQSYIHVTAALSSPTSSGRSDRVPDVRDLRRGYPNLPHGTRVQSRSVSRDRREVALHSDDGNPHLPHPNRYSAWDDGYYPSTRRDYSGRQEHTAKGHMEEYGREPRSCGLSKTIYLQGPSVVGKIPRARC